LQSSEFAGRLKGLAILKQVCYDSCVPNKELRTGSTPDANPPL